ncbi:hypothetical protein DBP15_18305 [Streptomyces sp. CS065A]|nr:hypothetical protein DBP15_18305 [Streptomyces sp. CS065A]
MPSPAEEVSTTAVSPETARTTPRPWASRALPWAPPAPKPVTSFSPPYDLAESCDTANAGAVRSEETVEPEARAVSWNPPATSANGVTERAVTLARRENCMYSPSSPTRPERPMSP